MVIHQPATFLRTCPLDLRQHARSRHQIKVRWPAIIGGKLRRSIIRNLAHLDQIGPQQQHQRSFEQACMFKFFDLFIDAVKRQARERS